MTTPSVVWQVKSRYALVTCINNGRGVIVEKEIAPENVNSENARWVNDTSMYFRGKLRGLGVLLAEPYTFDERGEKAIQTSPYVGLNLSEIFHREPTPEVLDETIATIRGVLAQTKREVGIDARLSNFCLGPDKKVLYIDTFPPLVLYKGEYLVHFPNPKDPVVIEQELQRKFDPLGILRRLRFSVLSQGAGITEVDILGAVGSVMGEVFGRCVQDFFRTLPDNKDVSVALEEMTLIDPDAIRELALRFMPPRGEARDQYLSKVFDLSSNFCPLKITAAERVARLRDLFVAENQR